MASELAELIKPNITILNKKYLVMNLIYDLPEGGYYYGQVLDNQKIIFLKIFYNFPLNSEEQFVALEDEYYQFVELAHPVLQKPLELLKAELDGQLIPVLVLDKPEGASAKNSLKVEDGGYFEQNRAMLLLAELCEGLLVLHAAGYVHGGLNSDNILITPDDQPLLLNIPFIKQLEHDTANIELQKYYQAPELFAEEKADIKTDIYAVGCLLHEFLEGRPPFLGDDQEELHQEEECPGLNGIPPVINKLMLKCLEKSCGSRQDGLDSVIKTLRKAYRPPSSGNKGLKSALVLAVLLMAGGGFYFTSQPAKKPVSSAVDSVEAPKKVRKKAERRPAEETVSENPEESTDSEMVRNTTPADDAETMENQSDKSKTPRPSRRSRSREKTVEKKAIIGEPITGMVFFAGGEFNMGSSEEHDAPVHRVQLSPFYLDLLEVTNEDFKLFVDEAKALPPTNSSATFNLWQGNSYPAEISRQPVINVNWQSAHNYCSHRGKRLPTEAEWEFAARGTTGRAYPWGNNYPTEAIAQFDAEWDGADTLFEADFFATGVSPEGVFNLFGGVREWVSDWYSVSYYQESPPENPIGPEQGEQRVVRGASWEDPDDYNSAIRARERPDVRLPTLGFRCAKDMEVLPEEPEEAEELEEPEE